jgi:hypothetical protein
MATDHIYKSGVTKSNVDVIVGVPRPQVAETTAGRNLETTKPSKIRKR